MKFTFLICTGILLSVFTVNAFAQISGISNSKIVIPESGTVPAGTFEFEPAFEVFRSNQAWNKDGSLFNLGSRTTESALGFRLTAGFKHNIEAGLIVPQDVSSLNFGLKWQFRSGGDASLALQSGINFDTKSGVRSNEAKTAKIIGSGLVLTYIISEDIVVDSDFTISYHSNDTEGEPVDLSGTMNLGIGYFLHENFQGVVELNSASARFVNSGSTSKTSGVLGFTYNASELTKVIMGVKYDLFGSNNDKGIAYIGAFTFVI